MATVARYLSIDGDQITFVSTRILDEPGLQKVNSAGTAGTGKQSDLRGRSVYFYHIPIHF